MLRSSVVKKVGFVGLLLAGFSVSWSESEAATTLPDRMCQGVPATGQTECWDAFGKPVSCSRSGQGQDGLFQHGFTVDPRFTDNRDGTVTDNLTGLIWLQDANCFGVLRWIDALLDTNHLADGSCANGPTCNTRMGPADLERFAAIAPEGRRLLVAACERMGLSARAFDRVRRVARTIADLEASERIRTEHLAEGLQYRTRELAGPTIP